MKYGFTIPGSGPLTDPDAMSAVAKRGEELGYDIVVVPDHIILPRDIDSVYPYAQDGIHPGTRTGSCLEQLTVLAFIAGQTSRIRIGTSVMIVPHRNPFVAAKALATLDVLSKGRVVLGVGAGWLEVEFDTLGLPPFKDRGAVTDEYIQVFKELWTSDAPEFHGEHVDFSNVTFLPKPVQKPHIPIWVGGESGRDIRRAARLCDGWCPLGVNPAFPLGTPQLLEEAIGKLFRQTERAGRDPSKLEITFRVTKYSLNDSASAGSPSGREPFNGNPDQVVADVRRYQDMGVTGLLMDFAGVAGSSVGDPSQVVSLMEDFAEKVWPAV